MESRSERDNQIELAAKIRQSFKTRDSIFETGNSQEVDEIVKKRDSADIQPQAVMTQRLRNKKKKSASTTDIENLLRRKAMQIQVLRATDVPA